MADQSQVSFQRRGDSTLVVCLSGAWQLHGGLPSTALLDRQLQPTARVQDVVFDAEKLTSWDSSVLTFLLQLSEVCRERGIVVEHKGLPPGLRRLLALAKAVPERKGARREATEASFLERVGSVSIGLASSELRIFSPDPAARRGGAGIDVRVETIRRQIGPRYRHENFRRIGAAQRTAEKGWFRTQPSGDGCKGTAWQELKWQRIPS